jgi:hypothetical protein
MENQFGETDISYASYLTIKPKRVKNNDYLIIKGSVKNNGLRKVTQCRIVISIYDQNNHIINTDQSKVFGDIAPGKTKNFHSITAWPNSAKTYNLTIEEIRVK